MAKQPRNSETCRLSLGLGWVPSVQTFVCVCECVRVSMHPIMLVCTVRTGRVCVYSSLYITHSTLISFRCGNYKVKLATPWFILHYDSCG